MARTHDDIAAAALTPWRPFITADLEREMTSDQAERARVLARAVREAQAAEHYVVPNYIGILLSYVRRPCAGISVLSDTDAESWAKRIQVEARGARLTQAKRQHCQYTVDDIIRQRLSYGEAEEHRRLGLISDETLDAYAYAFRDGAFRYTYVGLHQALRHASALGLPLPLSDLPQAERDARRAAREGVSG